MSTVFTSTFGGSAVSPADVAYAAYSFADNLILFWPAFSAGQTDVAARFMNLTATANSLDVFMPDATLVSVGYDVIIFNAGADTFNIVSTNGNAIATIATGQTYYILLNGNTTEDGTWQTVQFGVGTGSASAAALAGAGLLAAAGLLEQNILGTTLSGSTTLTSTARAVLQVWNGGVGTVTLPSAASVGNGFFFPFANDGSGSVTVATSGGDQIDGASTSVFTQTQSAFIVSTGTAWFTVGKGLQNNFSVTVLNLNVAGSSDIVETSSQAQSIIQQYTGILTGNIHVVVPATPQLYFVFNDTTGPYTLTVKTAAGTGITVAQGTNTILYCDGTNVVGAFTATFGTSISLPAGSAGSPTLNFQGSTSTGLYSPALNQIAVTAAGKEVMNFISNASAVNWLQSEATATGNSPIISAQGSDTNIGIILNPKGNGAIRLPKAIILGGTIDNTVIGGTTASTINGTTITASSFLGPLTGNVIGNVTGNLTGNVTGNISGSAPAGSLTGTTLAVNVVNSSLTSVGTLTNLTVTNPIVGNITGNSATVTTNANLTGAVTSVGNAASLGSFTSAQLATALTDETGSGANVFAGSPALTGTPTAPTAAANTNTTQIATTAFVIANTTAIKIVPAIGGIIPTVTATTSTTAAITFGTGAATDSTNTVIIGSVGYSWAVSNGNAINGYEGGTTLPNSSTIHFFLCTGATGTGIFASTSFASPNLPSGYNVSKRRVFSIKTDSSGNLISGVAIECEGGGLIFWYATSPILDYASTVSTSRSLIPLSVPAGYKLQALYRTSTPSSSVQAIICSPDEPDIAPSASTIPTTSPAWDVIGIGGGSSSYGRDGLTTTDTSGQVAARGTGTITVVFITKGFKDFRRS